MKIELNFILNRRGQKVQYGVGDGMFSRGPASFHQDSATTASEDDLPPPPPPMFEEETRRQKARLVRENREDTLATGTSKSTTSAASFTLTSNASIISSQTDESEEDSKKRVRIDLEKRKTRDRGKNLTMHSVIVVDILPSWMRRKWVIFQEWLIFKSKLSFFVFHALLSLNHII